MKQLFWPLHCTLSAHLRISFVCLLMTGPYLTKVPILSQVHSAFAAPPCVARPVTSVGGVMILAQNDLHILCNKGQSSGNPVADIGVTVTDGKPIYSPGGINIYTLIVTNYGPSDVIGAVVDDIVPIQFASEDWICSGNRRCYLSSVRQRGNQHFLGQHPGQSTCHIYCNRAH